MNKIKAYTLITISIIILYSVSAFAQDTTHIVRAGETLWRISQRYNVTLNSLISLNTQISNPNLIYPGQRINLPDINDVTSIENQVIQLVNQERTARGISPLRANLQLSRVARYKSQDMLNNNYFSHISPVYGSPFKMMESFGIRFVAAGENIALGQRSPQEVMNSWMNSPGHRANILSEAFTEIGVGYAKGPTGRNYWTQMFVKP